MDAQLRELLSLDLKAVKAERQKLQHETKQQLFQRVNQSSNCRKLVDINENQS